MKVNLLIVIVILLGCRIAFSQKEVNVTKVVRNTGEMSDADWLDKQYNIDRIPMDRVFYVVEDTTGAGPKMKEWDENEQEIVDEQRRNSNPASEEARTLGNRDRQTIERNPPNAGSSGSVTQGSSIQRSASQAGSTSSSKSKSSSKKTRSKAKYRRVKLKKRRKVPQRRQKRCYRF